MFIHRGKDFTTRAGLVQRFGMTTPLALIFYENLLIGNQLINRLRDLGYRVRSVNAAELGQLASIASQEKPLIFLAELGAQADQVCQAVRQLNDNSATAHIPVLAIQRTTKKRADRKVAEAARAAGVALIAREAACLSQLPELLNRVLEVE